MKRVVLLLRHTPLNHIKNLEAFRLGLGLTLSNNEVTVAMMGEGVFNAINFRPEVVDRPSVEEFLSYYEAVGIRSVAEEEAVRQYHIASLRDGVALESRKAILDTIRRADIVIPF